MANLVRYFIRKLGANFVDFSLDYPGSGFSLNGSDVVFLGSSGVDRVYLPKGIKFNFSNSGGGTDQIYLDGSFADYTLSAKGTSTLVLSAAKANTQITLAQEDKVFFQDGSIAVADLLTYAIARSANLATPADPNTPAPTAPTLNAAQNSLSLPSTSNADGSSSLDSLVRAYTKDPAGVVFAQPSAGVKFSVTGHNGVDKVYVAKGGVVNANNLGSGVDLVYVTGKKNEYFALANGASVLILNKGTEQVTLASEDKVIFADGAVLVSAAITAATTDAAAATPTTAAWSALTLDNKVFTPGVAPQISIKSGQDAYLDITETSIDLEISYAKLAQGDTVQLKLAGSNLGTAHNVTSTEAADRKFGINILASNLGANGNKAISAVVTHSGTNLEGNPITLTQDQRPLNNPTLTLGSGVSNGATQSEALAASGVITVQADSGSTVLLTFTDSATPTAHSLVKTLTASGAVQAVTLLATDLGSGVGQLQDGTITVSASEQYLVSGFDTPTVNSSSSFTLDRVAPVRATATVVGNVLVINYDSLLDESHTAAPSDFQVRSTTNGTATLVAVDAVNVHGKSVELTLGTSIPASGTSVTVSFQDPSGFDDEDTIQDLAGNDAASFFTQSATLITALSISSMLVTDEVGDAKFGKASDTVNIALTFNEPVTVAGTVTFNFKVGSTGSTFTASATTNANASRTINLSATLPAGVTAADNGSISLTSITFGAGNSITGTASSRTLATQTSSDSSYRVDNIAPAAPSLLLGIGVSGGATLAEATASTGVLTVAGESGASVLLTITDSADASHTLIKTVLGKGTTALPVLLTADDLTSLGVSDTSLAPVNYQVSANATDAAGNSSSTAATASFSIDAGITPPSLSLGSGVSGGATAAEATASSGVLTLSAESGSKVLLTFTDSSTPTAHSLIRTITATGSEQPVTLATSNLGAGASQLQDGSISVTATATDAAGNVSTADSSSFKIDRVAPSAATLSVVGNKLTLSFNVNETLDSDSTHLPDASAFVVRSTPSGGSAAAVAVDSIAVSGSQLVLTLASPVAFGATSTTVAYTDPSTSDDSNAIQDLAGNDLATFAARPVTNNTPAAPKVSSLVITDAVGDIHTGKSGDVLTVVLTFSEPVTVAGAPVFSFTIGSSATPVSFDVTATASAAEDPASTTLTLTTTLPESATSTNDRITLTGVTLGAGDSITGSNSNVMLEASYLSSHPLTDNSYTVDNTVPTAAAPTLALGNGVSNGANFAEATSSGGVVLVTAAAAANVLVSFANADYTVPQVVKTVQGNGAAQVRVVLTNEDLVNLGIMQVTWEYQDAAGVQLLYVAELKSGADPLSPWRVFTAIDSATIGSYGSTSTWTTIKHQLLTSAQIATSNTVFKYTQATSRSSASTINVTAAVTDAAGNSGTAASTSFSMDAYEVTGIPSITLGSGIDSSYFHPDASNGATRNEATASTGVLSLTAESGSTVSVTFSDSSTPAHSIVKTFTSSGAALPVTLLASELGMGASQLQDGDINIRSVATLSGKQVSLPANNKFTLDTKAPLITAANASSPAISLEDNLLTLNFDAAMDSSAANLPAASAFSVMTTPAGGTATAVTVNSIAVSGSQVVLTLAAPISQGNTTTVAYTDPSAGDDSQAIQDASGNDLASFTARQVSNTTPTRISGMAFTDASGAPQSGKAGDAVSVVIRFNGPVTVAGAPVFNFRIGSSGATFSATASATPANATASNTLTLTATLPLSATSADNGNIVLTGVTLAAGSSITGSISNTMLNPAYLTSHPITDRYYSVYNTITPPEQPTLTLGNGVSGVSAAASLAEATASSGVLSVTTESGSSVLITFTDSSTPTAHSLIKTIRSGSTATPVTLATSDIGPGDNQLQDGSITVTAIASSPAGNASSQTSSFVLDATAPTPTPQANGTPALTVVGNKLTLNFSETLDASAVPPFNAFAVYYRPLGGSSASSNAVTAAAISGKQVVLTLTTAIPFGAGVTLRYTDANAADDASNVIQDLAGNDAASIPSQSIANLTSGRPIVQRVEFSDAVGDAHYGKPGAALSVDVYFSEPVTINGTVNFAFRVVNGPAFGGSFTGTGAVSQSITVTLTLPDASAGVSNGNIQLTNISLDALSSIVGTQSNQPLLPSSLSSPLGDSGYWVDSIAPALPLITLGTGIADGASRAEATATTGVLTVSAESGSSVVLTLLDSQGHGLSKSLTASGTAQTVTLVASDIGNGAAQLADGNIHISATATDAAGNSSSASSSFVLDLNPPAAPWLTLGSGINNASGDAATRAEATASSGVIKVRAEAGSSVLITFTDSATPSAHSLIKTVTALGLQIASAVPVTLSANDLGAGTAQLSDGSISVTASATDSAGNASTSSNSSSFVLDSVAPQLLGAQVEFDQLTLRYDSTLDSDSTHLPPTSAFAVTVGGTANTVTAVKSSGNNLLLTLNTPAAPNAAVRVSYTTPSVAAASGPLQDLAGNDAANISNFSVANSSPFRLVITRVALNDADSGAAMYAGKSGASGLTGTAYFSEAVNVTGGTVTLGFNNADGTATAFTGTIAADASATTFSTSKSVTFTGTTLPAGDFAVYLDSVSLGGSVSIRARTLANSGTGTVLDDSNFALEPLATRYVVDNTAPGAITNGGRLFAVDSSNVAIDPAVRDTLKVGDKLVLEIPLTEATTITGTSNGKPEIDISIGSAVKKLAYDASYPSTTSSKIYATYTIAAEDVDTDGVSSSGADLLPSATGTTSLTDQAGNVQTSNFGTPLAATGNIATLKVDAAAPTVSSLTPVAPDNSRPAYRSGERVLIAVEFSEKVVITGTPQIPLTVGSAAKTALYDSSNPRNTDTVKYFSFTVAAGDTDTDGIALASGSTAIALNGGTIKDVIGNAGVLTISALAATYNVDGTAPGAPTLALGSGVASAGANLVEALQSSGVVTVRAESGSNVLVTFTDSLSHKVIKTVSGTGSAEPVILAAIDLGEASNQIKDGSVNVSASASDGAGNTSPAGNSSFTLAAKVPTLVLSLGSGVANGATQAEATASSGVVRLRGDAGNSITLTFSDSSSPAHTITRTIAATGSEQAVILASSELGTGSTQLGEGVISVSASSSNANGSSTDAATQFVLDTEVPTGLNGVRSGLRLQSSSNQYASLPSAAAAVSGDLTLEAWVYASASGTYTSSLVPIISLKPSDVSNNAFVTLGLDVRKLYFWAHNGTTNLGQKALTSNFATDVWTHVAVTVGTGSTPSYNIYVNGVSEMSGTLTAALVSTAYDLSFLGTSTTAAGASTFNGVLSDVRIYDSARTAANIASDMTGMVNTGDSNLKGYYPLDTSATVSGKNGGGALTLTGSPILTTPALTFSTDTDTVGDYITSKHAQTITLKLGSTLDATDVLEGSLDDGNPNTWSNLNAYVSGTTLSWPNANLLVGKHALKFQIKDHAGNESAVFSQTYETGSLNAPTLTLAAAVTDGANRTEATASSGVLSVNATSGTSVVVSFTDALNHTLNKTLTATGSNQQVTLASSDIGTGANQLYNGPVTVKAQATPTDGVASEEASTSFNLYATMLALGSGAADGVNASEVVQASGVVTLFSASGGLVRVTFTDSSSPSAHSVVKTLTGTGATQAVTLVAADIGAGVGQLNNGNISVSAVAYDASNQPNNTGSASFTLNARPGMPILGGPGFLNASDIGTATLIQAESSSTVTVTFTDSSTPTPHSVIKTVTGQGAATTVPVPLVSGDIGAGANQLAQGVITVTATATNSIGLVSDPATSHSFTLDTLPPPSVPSQKGLQLDSSKGQYVQLPAAAAAVSGDLTLEAWVYANGTQGSWASIFDLASGTSTADNTSAHDNLVLGFKDLTGRLAFTAFNGNGNKGEVAAPTALSLNAWHHVAVTVGSGNTPTAKLYVDGALEASVTLGAAIDSVTRSKSLVGKANLYGNANFNGTIRDVRIYDNERTAAEIASDKGTNSTPGSGTVNTSDSNLIGYYPFSTSAAESGKTGVTAAMPKYTSTDAFPFPTIGNPSLRFSADTGVPNDYITSTQTQTITATLSAPLAGDQLWGSLDSGSTWSNLTASVTGTTLTWSNVTLLSGSGRQLRLATGDAAGNNGTLLTQDYSYVNDTVAPTATIDERYGLTLNSSLAESALLPQQAVAVSGDLTLEAWVFAKGTQNSFTRILDFNDKYGASETEGKSNNIILGITTDLVGPQPVQKLAFQAYKNGSSIGEVKALNAFPLDSWHHVAVTTGGTDAKDVTLYIDGVSVQTGTLTATIPSLNRPKANIGLSNYSGAENNGLFNGSIRELRIYDITRTTEQIPIDMDSVNNAVSTTNLTSYYPFVPGVNLGTSWPTWGVSAATPTTNTGISKPTLTLSNDTGTKGDYITSTAAQTITAIFKTAPAAGEKVWGSIDDGGTWTDLSSVTSSNFVTWPNVTLLSGTHTLEFQVRDSAGNCGPLISQSYQVI